MTEAFSSYISSIFKSKSDAKFPSESNVNSIEQNFEHSIPLSRESFESNSSQIGTEPGGRLEDMKSFLFTKYGLSILLASSLSIVTLLYLYRKRRSNQNAASNDEGSSNQNDFSMDMGDYLWFPKSKSLVYAPRKSIQSKGVSSKDETDVLEQLIFDTLNAGLDDSTLTSSARVNDTGNDTLEDIATRRKSAGNLEEWDEIVETQLQEMGLRTHTESGLNHNIPPQLNTTTSSLKNEKKPTVNNILNSETQFSFVNSSSFAVPDSKYKENEVQSIILSSLNSGMEDDLMNSFEESKLKSSLLNFESMDGISEKDFSIIFNIDEGFLSIRKHLLLTNLSSESSQYPISRRGNTIYLHDLGIEIACGDKKYVDAEKEVVRYGMNCYEAKCNEKYLAFWVQRESIQKLTTKEIITDILKSFKENFNTK